QRRAQILVFRVPPVPTLAQRIGQFRFECRYVIQPLVVCYRHLLVEVIKHALERVILELGYHKSFECPSRCHYLTDPGHAHGLGHHRIEFFKPNHDAAEQQLRDDQYGDENIDRHCRTERTGDVKPKQVGKARTTEQDKPIPQFSQGDFQYQIPDRNKTDRLDRRNREQHRDLSEQVASLAQVQKPFSLEQLTVAKDFLGTHGQPQKQRHHHTHKKVYRNVVVLIEGISRRLHTYHVIVFHHKGDEQRE